MFKLPRMLRNNMGCFGGSPKMQSAPAQPVPSPSPQLIAPSKVEGVISQDERRQKMNRLRNGLASTIKTSAKGLTGSGADLMSQMVTGKEKIGV